MMIIRKRKNRIWTGFAWLLSAIILIPLYMVVINSLKDKREAARMNLSIPKIFQGSQNYKEMIKSGGILTGFFNSTIVTVLAVVIIILFASTLAYVLQRRKDRFTKGILILIILGLVFPLQIIPAYFLCDFLRIPKYVSAILLLAVVNLSFSVFTYIGYLKGVSTQIDEAGIIDGASPLRLFFQVIFPLLKPVTVTNIIIAFMSVWNDFGITIYFLNSSKNYTLPLTIYNFFSTHNSDWQLVFANVVVVSMPVIIVYLVLQKHIISGMTSGAVKG